MYAQQVTLVEEHIDRVGAPADELDEHDDENRLEDLPRRSKALWKVSDISYACLRASLE